MKVFQIIALAYNNWQQTRRKKAFEKQFDDLTKFNPKQLESYFNSWAQRNAVNKINEIKKFIGSFDQNSEFLAGKDLSILQVNLSKINEKVADILRPTEGYVDPLAARPLDDTIQTVRDRILNQQIRADSSPRAQSLSPRRDSSPRVTILQSTVAPQAPQRAAVAQLSPRAEEPKERPGASNDRVIARIQERIALRRQLANSVANPELIIIQNPVGSMNVIGLENLPPEVQLKVFQDLNPAGRKAVLGRLLKESTQMPVKDKKSFLVQFGKLPPETKLFIYKEMNNEKRRAFLLNITPSDRLLLEKGISAARQRETDAILQQLNLPELELIPGHELDDAMLDAKAREQLIGTNSEIRTELEALNRGCEHGSLDWSNFDKAIQAFQ